MDALMSDRLRKKLATKEGRRELRKLVASAGRRKAEFDGFSLGLSRSEKDDEDEDDA